MGICRALQPAPCASTVRTSCGAQPSACCPQARLPAWMTSNYGRIHDFGTTAHQRLHAGKGGVPIRTDRPCSQHEGCREKKLTCYQPARNDTLAACRATTHARGKVMAGVGGKRGDCPRNSACPASKASDASINSLTSASTGSVKSPATASAASGTPQLAPAPLA
eukprot:148601-Chlamydomonas_euryale.AAC.1